MVIDIDKPIHHSPVVRVYVCASRVRHMVLAHHNHIIIRSIIIIIFIGGNRIGSPSEVWVSLFPLYGGYFDAPPYFDVGYI